MSFISELQQHLEPVFGAFDAEMTAEQLPSVVTSWEGDRLLAVMRENDKAIRALQLVNTVLTGAIAARSTRELGHDGLAQKEGFRNPEALIQSITGTSRTEAARQTRVGRSMFDDAVIEVPVVAPATDVANEPPVPPVPPVRWDDPLRYATAEQLLTTAQHDAIRRGLGEPPTDPGNPAFDTAGAINAWRNACEQLVGEADRVSVEELFRAARTIRDILDPDGARDRYDKAFEARSFKTWVDADGIQHAKIRFEPLGAAEFTQILNAVMRPRTGGPRFVDAEQQQRADVLRDDPRTNEQLAYDFFMDTINSGARADVETVFGVQQTGVRVVSTAQVALDVTDVLENLKGFPTTAGHGEPNSSEPHENPAPKPPSVGVGVFEDGLDSLPDWLVQQRVCLTGTARLKFTRDGDPLYVGRTRRTFTPKQRIAIAIRDGGCMWHGCDRPASMCETHHIDHWHNGGATDIDRGILLCRYHHMKLHNHGYRITRNESRPGQPPGEFILHPPPGHGEPTPLKRKLALKYILGDLNPKRRFIAVA